MAILNTHLTGRSYLELAGQLQKKPNFHQHRNTDESWAWIEDQGTTIRSPRLL